MATRFYLHSSGSAAVSPAFDPGWEQNGQAVRLPMDLKMQQGPQTTLTNSSAITVPITTTQQILGYQFVSNKVFRPFRFTSATFSMIIRGLENATTNNVFLAYVLRAMRSDGGLSLATLASSMTNAGTEFTGSAQTRIFNAAAIANNVISQPWRLVLEIGGHAQAPTAAGSYTYRVGTSAASDFALTSGLTTDLNPWAELNIDLGLVSLNNYRSVTAGGSSSVGEQVR
jgi:hypothetical protein